ncbi:P-loop containing nucleoside triphosphate hydrolase protein [Gorgonomyces haynaldii]|nr:P-loop containing nucleoside triphosphate hydrolase protein [Gorgonomyces haynaldii]
MSKPKQQKELPPLQAGQYYIIDVSDDGTRFHFPDVPSGVGEIPVKTVVRNLTGMKLMSHTEPKYLWFVLGRLRGLYHLLSEFNSGIDKGDKSLYHTRYIRYQVMQNISSFGYQIPDDKTKILVPGLQDLIKDIEQVYKQEIQLYRTLVAENAIVFDALQELYLPGTIVRGMTSLGIPAGFKVVQGYYQERKTVFGYEQSFHLDLQFVVSLGEHFIVIEYEAIMSRWMGEANRKISEMFYAPCPSDLHEKFLASGEKYIKLGLGEPKFLQHAPGTVFLHGTKRGQLGTSSQALGTSGRVLIDVVRGSALGHHASHGMDDATHALIETTGRYRRFINEQRSLGQEITNPDSIFIISQVPEQLKAITWPALVGFSFSAKSWCHVFVAGLSEIKFNDQAFDELVLEPKRKQLIRALVRFGGEQFEDIIQGKSGGSIFLLHGPAGVGKTLTAEAIAEVLHKPLYYVTMGELGTDPEVLEKRLMEILELCAGWGALTLIDEADVFLEKRATSDVLRNAMVCVMLRLVEYHQGILFLTTNRVTEFDPAFESRVTVALKYDHLTPSAREQVWRNLISRLPIERKDDIDFPKLSQYVLNGRQIKNAVRLALALAMDARQPLDQACIEETVAITNMGRTEMATADKF